MLFWQCNENLKEWKVLNAKDAKTRDEQRMRVFLRASKAHWEGGVCKLNSLSAPELRLRGFCHVPKSLPQLTGQQVLAVVAEVRPLTPDAATWPFPLCYKSTHQENSCNSSSLPQKEQLTYCGLVYTQKPVALSPSPQAHSPGISVWEEQYFTCIWGDFWVFETYLLCISQGIFTSKQTQGCVHISAQTSPGKILTRLSSPKNTLNRALILRLLIHYTDQFYMSYTINELQWKLKQTIAIIFVTLTFSCCE